MTQPGNASKAHLTTVDVPFEGPSEGVAFEGRVLRSMQPLNWDTAMEMGHILMLNKALLVKLESKVLVVVVERTSGGRQWIQPNTICHGQGERDIIVQGEREGEREKRK